jgi:hypothetical protein
MPLQFSSMAMDASVSAGRPMAGRQELGSMQIRPPRGLAPLYQDSRHDQGCEGCQGLLQPHSLLSARLWCAPLSVVAPSRSGGIWVHWHVSKVPTGDTVIYVAPRNGPGDRFVYFVWQQTSKIVLFRGTHDRGCHEPPPVGSIEGWQTHAPPQTT